MSLTAIFSGSLSRLPFCPSNKTVNIKPQMFHFDLNPRWSQTHNKLYNYSVKICQKAWKADSIPCPCWSDQLSMSINVSTQKTETGTQKQSCPWCQILNVIVPSSPLHLVFMRDLKVIASAVSIACSHSKDATIRKFLINLEFIDFPANQSVSQVFIQ